MTTTTGVPVAPELPALGAQTLCEAFQITAAAYADRPALRTTDGAVELTWADYAARVRSIAGGLAGIGVGHGDTVALLLDTRPEFNLVDTAALHRRQAVTTGRLSLKRELVWFPYGARDAGRFRALAHLVGARGARRLRRTASKGGSAR